MVILGINTQQRYEKLSWNDLTEMALKRGLSVPPFKGIESYVQPTPREKLIAELVQLDRRPWKNLLIGIGIATSILSLLKIIPFAEGWNFLKKHM
jgi:hypothetical protein